MTPEWVFNREQLEGEKSGRKYRSLSLAPEGMRESSSCRGGMEEVNLSRGKQWDVLSLEKSEKGSGREERRVASHVDGK